MCTARVGSVITTWLNEFGAKEQVAKIIMPLFYWNPAEVIEVVFDLGPLHIVIEGLVKRTTLRMIKDSTFRTCANLEHGLG